MLFHLWVVQENKVKSMVAEGRQAEVQNGDSRSLFINVLAKAERLPEFVLVEEELTSFEAFIARARALMAVAAAARRRELARSCSVKPLRCRR